MEFDDPELEAVFEGGFFDDFPSPTDDDGVEESNDWHSNSVELPAPTVLSNDQAISSENVMPSELPTRLKKRRKLLKTDTSQLSTTSSVEDAGKHWSDLHLDRQLLRALSKHNWERPTEIQLQAIPLATAGRDIFATAETGSGKTGAFVLPILQRLINSPGVKTRRVSSVGIIGGRNATKALILLPTRELASQCYEVVQNLSEFSAVTSALVSGGWELQAQERALRQQPDIVIATPGRVLDLLINSQSISMELLEIVILDEADILMDLGFKDECLSILRLCSKQRQTVLFSATSSETISDLAVLALRQPARLTIHTKNTVALSLKQEFVLLRSNDDSEGYREAALLHLCTTVYTRRVIIFFQRKVEAHRMAITFKRFGLPSTELHGNLEQPTRMKNLKMFVTGEAEFLLASELASRGLDIPNVETVINYHPAWDIIRHVHRVGRTARMGNEGVAVTLYNLSEKLMIKKLNKCAVSVSGVVPRIQREILLEDLENWKTKLVSVVDDVASELRTDEMNKELTWAESQLKKFDEMKLQTPREIILGKKVGYKKDRSWHIGTRERLRIRSEMKETVFRRRIGSSANETANETPL